MNKRIQTLKYLVIDFLSAFLSWNIISLYLVKYVWSSGPDEVIPVTLRHIYYTGLIIVPAFWILLYYISGYYNVVYRKSRLSETWQTLGNILIGVAILYLVLHKSLKPYASIDSIFLVYFTLHFLIAYIPRLVITTITTKRIHRGEIGYNTLIIGSNAKAVKIYQEITGQVRGSGNKFVGFVNVDDKTKNLLGDYLSHLGSLDRIRTIIVQHCIEEVIIAIESSEHHKINRIINKLIETNVVIKAIPSTYDILTGKVKMNSILGTPLILVSHQLMPAWQENLKNILDFTILHRGYSANLSFQLGVLLRKRR